MAKYAMAQCGLAMKRHVSEVAVAIGNAVQWRMSQWQCENASPISAATACTADSLENFCAYCADTSQKFGF